MAMNKGNAACTSGLSQRIYDYWTADENNGFSVPLTSAQDDNVKSLCWAVAQAVYDEITTNAETSVDGEGIL